MSILQNLFGSRKTAALEVYGKLPFYQDYIAVLSTADGVAWKSWLLGFAGRQGVRLPPGRWLFLFRRTRKSPLTAGIIEPSSDGIREFPFSLFVSLDGIKTGLLPAAALTTWRLLLKERGALDGVSSIDQCYQQIRGRQLLLEPAKEEQNPQLAAALGATPDGNRPLFLICAPNRSGPIQPLVWQGSESVFMAKWSALPGAETPD